MSRLHCLRAQHCVASLASSIIEFSKNKLNDWSHRIASTKSETQRRAAFVRDLPVMGERDRQILAFLVEKQVKTFTGAIDGGYAVGLIGRGIILRTIQGTQVIDNYRMPYMVADWAWDAINEEKALLPYTPVMHRGAEIAPWVELRI